MTPFFFGSRHRRLFGLLVAPRVASRQPCATLLCNPFGQEYIRAHRSMRRLANQLCDRGHSVMRFDYFGTGDSEGSSDAVSVAGFVDDVLTAMDELKDMTETRSVNLVGLRMGATLVAKIVASGRRDIRRAVLWDPIITGAALVDEMAGGSRPPVPRPSEQGGGFEFMGFPWPAAFVDELRSIDVRGELESADVPILSIHSRRQPNGSSLDLLFRRQESSNVTVEAPAAWEKREEFGAGTIPVAAIDEIVGWLGGGSR